LKYYLFTDRFGLSEKPEEHLRPREARYDRDRRVRLRVSEDLETMEEVSDGSLGTSAKNIDSAHPWPP